MVCTCTIDGIDSKPDMCYNYKDIQDIWIRTYWLNMLCVYFTNLTVELHNKWIYGYEYFAYFRIRLVTMQSTILEYHPHDTSLWYDSYSA
jgi:hypothetical protein